MTAARAGHELRVIAGQWRSRRLRVPRRAVRPTQDRVRQILFDILGPVGVAGSVLDLYAGSGALGLEALSRGAESVVFVESDADVREVLRGNIEMLGAGAGSVVVGLPVLRAIPRLASEGRRFDLVLADPPYRTEESVRALESMGRTEGFFREGARVVFETERAALLPERVGSLERSRLRPVGETELHFYVSS